MRRLALTLGALIATAAPAKAHTKREECTTRECRARVAHRNCDQQHPRWCVLHVIYHKHIQGWQRAWLLRVPGCESGWNPYAINGAPFNRAPTPAIYGPPERSASLYQFMPSTWATTPYARRSIWSARWQAYAAAWMARVGRAGEWTCA